MKKSSIDRMLSFEADSNDKILDKVDELRSMFTSGVLKLYVSGNFFLFAEDGEAVYTQLHMQEFLLQGRNSNIVYIKYSDSLYATCETVTVYVEIKY